MATRLLGQTSRATNWEGLLRKAITRAEAVGDKRIAVLKKALSAGTASATLKRMGIIGDNDLQREFPPREK